MRKADGQIVRRIDGELYLAGQRGRCWRGESRVARHVEVHDRAVMNPDSRGAEGGDGPQVVTPAIAIERYARLRLRRSRKQVHGVQHVDLRGRIAQAEPDARIGEDFVRDGRVQVDGLDLA